jgi:RNA polymerase sigma-70 factor (ECF subfamily)
VSQKQYQTVEDQVLTELIIRQQTGWRDMLSTLLQRHHSALLARCYAYLKNREDAEDAAQETELRAFRAIKNFRGDSSFRTWLFAIGDHQCHDLVRKRTRRVIDDHLRALIEIHEASIDRISPVTEHHAAVNNALSRLPEQERDVILLRYYRDLSLEDVSSTLGIGLSATKMRLYRALDKFTVLLRIEQPPLHV